ncbi:MAG: hypothetical protein LBJ18_02075 [Rickettsiales bacterium]|nr:hypothetical protein [Rickettsiales bacterium]
MKICPVALFAAFFAPFAAFAAREGTPTYYQSAGQANANQANYGAYQQQGYTKYVGQSGQKQIVGSNSYSYTVPRPEVPQNIDGGIMTPNGIAMPQSEESKFVASAGFTRRFADFKFETGVNSILEWDDMIFNEISVGGQYNFQVKNYDLFAYGEYSMGSLSHGGMSMDYDLKPYDEKYPEYGIFTISMGDLSGSTDHLRLGFGAKHIWDLAGWKLSPSIGYEIFHHNLEMSNHIYPNPGIYLPLLDMNGNYLFGDEEGRYYSIPQGSAPPEGLYQVCMSPEDIKLVTGVQCDANGMNCTILTGDYPGSAGGLSPWGVYDDQCVIIGGDGPIVVPGTTHIYNTTWSGIYFGLEMEKQMTLKDKLRFYVQVGMPNYSSEGIWPNRTDWQQNPSFIDEGNNGSLSYRAEMEYDYKISDRMQLALKVDTDYFYVGKIGGELYVASYTDYALDQDGYYIDANQDGIPDLITVPAHTEKIRDSLKSAVWQSFGLHLGIKYAF